MPALQPQPPAPGRVWAHVGQPFTPGPHDVLIVGAGRMGTALALALHVHAPHRRTLLVEEGGLPNEDGATLLAPGVWTLAGLPDALHGAAHWTRAQLLTLGGDQLQSRPYLTLHAGAGPGRLPTPDALAGHPESLTLLNPASVPWATPQDALTYRPGLLAQQAAQQAIGQGTDLLLNTRVTPHPGGQVTLERLTVTNTHQIVTHETFTVQARTVILATGAQAPAQAEHHLGVHTRHGRAYRQTPHLNAPSRPGSPVLHVQGLTLRPQHDAYTLIPAVHHRDPHGYEPVGGHLTGVPTGLRRETLEDLVGLMDAAPVLATDALHLGRSLSDVPGAWLALPHGDLHAPPGHERLDEHTFLLLGGPLADSLGLYAADQLARQIAAGSEA
ncbi:FAD-dependent oxidoreductase [Deinococcus taeanensis]|uniref:FAD-dependent oxidoreductase n=1 Tax=Deinococcus taeanensis TaxID=2737050 RepID=UPI001CDD85C2|nr:FAD-dependent oxidoreductase [Deinococcus taeanensis]UBV42419.1 FAD-dependent oxidoreductase [Deinococcus taeanensis]